MKQKSTGNQEGFTIQELLVVLMVGSLLVSFSLSLFLFTQRMFFSWERDDRMRLAIERSTQAIALDMQQAREVAVRPDSLIVIQGGAGRKHEYRLTADTALRNGLPLLTEKGLRVSGRIAKQTVTAHAGDLGSMYLLELKGTWRGRACTVRCAIAAPTSAAGLFVEAGEQSEGRE